MRNRKRVLVGGLLLGLGLLAQACEGGGRRAIPEDRPAVEEPAPGAPRQEQPSEGLRDPAPAEGPAEKPPVVEQAPPPQAPVQEQEPRPETKPVVEQAPRPETRPTRPPAVAALLEGLAAQGVHLDLERRWVRLDGQVCILNANLEYVLVGKRGARHEALFYVDCKPSALNAALLALGLKPGENFQVREKVPPPPEADVLAGKVLPYDLVHPTGPRVYLTAEWAGTGDAVIRRRVEDLILNLKDNEPIKPREWVYFGGREAPLYKGEPPVFLADFEENLISVCYMSPSNHLITIVHELGLNQSLWWPNAELMPPQGTPVRFYISLEPLP